MEYPSTKMTHILFKKLIRKALFGYVGEMVLLREE